MRKAFDANVPKLKPRLKGAAPAVTLPIEEAVEEAPHAVRVPFTSPRADAPSGAGRPAWASTQPRSCQNGSA